MAAAKLLISSLMLAARLGSVCASACEVSCEGCEVGGWVSQPIRPSVGQPGSCMLCSGGIKIW